MQQSLLQRVGVQPLVLQLLQDNAKADGTQVLQPGSSVATALSEGESRPKHVQLLEVMGINFRLTKLPLQTVRPFVFEQVRCRTSACSNVASLLVEACPTMPPG